MKLRLSAALAVLAFAWAAAPAADATEVSVRVEGASATLLETTVDTRVHPVDGGDGSGAHPCRGPTGESPGPTVTGALDDAVRSSGLAWRGSWNNSSGDFLVTDVAGETGTTSGPWTILLNGLPIPVGGCSMKVVEGDRVLFARDVVFQTMTLGLSGPSTVEPGQPFSLLVTDERNGGAPVAGARVMTGALAVGSDPSGSASFVLDAAGRYSFKATHPDGIRSNSISVCVGVAGCSGSEGPAVRILDLHNASRFMRGAAPRTFRGRTAADGVEVSIRRRGGSGSGWVEASVKSGLWRVRTGTLAPGRYVVRARAVGVPGQLWRHGVNRVGFEVLPRRLGRKLLVRRSLRFLEREVRGGPVRSSGLLSSWAGLALGMRGRKSAGRLKAGLALRRPSRASTGDLARNLAAATRAGRGGPGIPGSRDRFRAMWKELVARQQDDGSFESDPNVTALAVLALADGYPATRAAFWLAGMQGSGGGFSASGSGPPDVDTTGLVAWALATRNFEPEVTKAAEFVRVSQNPDGGFPAVPGGRSNSQSTGMGLLAIHAANGPKLGPKTADGITPTHFLATLQRRSGSIDYMTGTRSAPVWVTSQALMGLATGRNSGR